MHPNSDHHAAICAEAITDAHHRLGKRVSDLLTSKRLEKCAHNWLARDHLPQADLRGMTNVHERCRQHYACIPCWWKRSHDEFEAAMAVYSLAFKNNPRLRETRFTFVGHAYPVLQAGTCVSETVDAWQRFSSSDTPFRSISDGYVRALSFAINQNAASITPTVSILSLGVDPNRLKKEHWEEDWNASAKEGQWKLENYSCREARLDEECVAFLQSLASVGLNPISLCQVGPDGSVSCDLELLRTIRDAFRSRHLISFGRDLSRTFLDDL